MNMSRYYNKTTRNRQDFEVGQDVAMREGRKWKFGKIVEKWHTPRSYIVKTGTGIYRRNTIDIRNAVIDNNTFKANTQQQPHEPRKTRSGKVYNLGRN